MKISNSFPLLSPHERERRNTKIDETGEEEEEELLSNKRKKEKTSSQIPSTDSIFVPLLSCAHKNRFWLLGNPHIRHHSVFPI